LAFTCIGWHKYVKSTLSAVSSHTVSRLTVLTVCVTDDDAEMSRANGERSSPLGADDCSAFADDEFSAQLQTFRDWQKSEVSPVDLVRAGFWYTGEADKVKCSFCRTVLKDWKRGDEPFQEHRRQAPDCPFVFANSFYTFYPFDISRNLLTEDAVS